MPKVKVRRLPGHEDLPLPQRMTPGSSGYDLYAAVTDVKVLQPGERFLVPTGLVLQLPLGWEAQIRPRSGLAIRYGLTTLNSPGTIDSDYRGEIGVILIHLGNEPYPLKRGERVAQMVFQQVAEIEWEEVQWVEDTGRGSGGFGSTGEI